MVWLSTPIDELVEPGDLLEPVKDLWLRIPDEEGQTGIIMPVKVPYVRDLVTAVKPGRGLLYLGSDPGGTPYMFIDNIVAAYIQLGSEDSFENVFRCVSRLRDAHEL